MLRTEWRLCGKEVDSKLTLSAKKVISQDFFYTKAALSLLGILGHHVTILLREKDAASCNVISSLYSLFSALKTTCAL